MMAPAAAEDLELVETSPATAVVLLAEAQLVHVGRCHRTPSEAQTKVSGTRGPTQTGSQPF